MAVDIRTSLVSFFAEQLSEMQRWSTPVFEDEYRYVVFDTKVDGQSFYVQFLLDAGKDEMVCEVASDFYAHPSLYVPTEAQRRAMTSLGFTDGRHGNFKRRVSASPSKNHEIARQTLSVLREIFEWDPRAGLRVTHGEG